jgi:hypothetical protein
MNQTNRFLEYFRPLTYVSVLFLALSVFGADVIVAPNPWVPEDGRDTNGTLAGGMRFINVPSSGEIFIFTITGNQVIRIEFVNNTSGEVKWNGKDDEDQYVASGVYLWMLKSTGYSRTGKLIVIR